MGGTDGQLADSSFAVGKTRSRIMAGWRRAVELAKTDQEIATLAALSRSRTEVARRVSRAQMLLAYRENPSCFAQWAKDSESIIRRCSAVSSERWPMGRWPPLRSPAPRQATNHHA